MLLAARFYVKHYIDIVVSVKNEPKWTFGPSISIASGPPLAVTWQSEKAFPSVSEEAARGDAILEL